MFTRHIEGQLASGILNENRSQMQKDLLDLHIALKLYKNEHGQYPKSLNKLAGKYGLINIAQDLLSSPTRPIQYELNKAGQVMLWSAGKDHAFEGVKPYRDEGIYRFDIGSKVWDKYDASQVLDQSPMFGSKMLEDQEDLTEDEVDLGEQPEGPVSEDQLPKE